MALGLLWSLTLIGTTRTLGETLRKAAVIRWLDRVTGVVFLLFAAKLALSRR
ncbi:threonine/homoserine/homoserine lactone efflux protein [Pseudomonas sp. AS2.8]|nr:threonine/homoserine/homoserine lactone efflux protein [Pseudomonas sp. AS2.8]